MPFLTRFGVNELGTDESAAFLLLLVPVAATVVFALPSGWLGDRFGKKRMLMVGLIAMGASVMLGSQVQTVSQAVALLVVTGAANALCFVLLFPLLADLMPEDRSGEFTGLGSGVWELAQPLGAVLGGLAADVTGSLRTTLFVAALLVLVAAVLLAPVRATRSTQGASRWWEAPAARRPSPAKLDRCRMAPRCERPSTLRGRKHAGNVTRVPRVCQ